MAAPVAAHTHNNYHLLRHVAAAMVVIAHCLEVHEPVFRLTGGQVDISNLGVRFFFIISGYLVTGSLLQTSGRIGFAAKRLLRLWPALLLVTALLSFVLGPIVSDLSASNYWTDPLTWRFFFRNSSFTPVYVLPGVMNGAPINSTFWSLIFEVISYVLLFIIGKRLLQRFPWSLLAGWILLTVLKQLHLMGLLPFASGYLFDGLFSMVYLFISASVWYLYRPMVRVRPLLLMIVAAVVVLGSYYIQLPLLLSSTLRDLAWVVIITGIGNSKALFTWPSWDISYGTYLMAYPVECCLRWYLFPKNEHPFLLLLLTLLITIPLAAFSWHFVERPALKWKQRL